MGKEFINDLLTKAYAIGNDAEFNVNIDSDERIESSIMSYIELGTFLITNGALIEKIDIKLKRD